MNSAMLKYGWLIGFASFFCTSGFSQYLGGQSDGNDKSGVTQMTLKGLQINSAPLFLGGQGDGHDKQFHSAPLNGPSLVILYSGGSGDGHHKVMFNGVMDGTDLIALYSGGNGDGYDKEMFNGVMDGTMLASLFSGGAGDGHDKEMFNGVIDGTALAALFSGGNGDGFDKAPFNGVLDGTMLASLFSGGAGDGYDKALFNGVIDGTSLAGMYSGGIGDGFDKTMFSGILAVPLPVELIVFDAFVEHRHVVAFWITAVEINNDYFTVQRTKDFNQIESIGDVPTQGNLNGEQEYSFIDPAPYQGTSYYRLQITALDNETAFSDWVAVKFELPDDFENLTLFPNPLALDKVTLKIEDLQPDWNIHIRITSMDGRVILEKENLEFATGSNVAELDLGNGLVPGMYAVQVYGDFEKTVLLMKVE